MRSDFSRYKSYPTYFSELQCDLLTGTMLGDGSLPHKQKGRYTCFSYEQTCTRRGYIEHIFDVLTPFTDRTKIRPVVCDKTKYGKGIYTVLKFRSMCHPLFSQMRAHWYDDPHAVRAKKIVPEDLQLNWRAVAYWFADDGHRRKNRAKEIVLCSENFTTKQNEFLLANLEKLGVVGTISKRNRIRIVSKHYFDFIDAVYPHLSGIDCLKYKIDVEGMSRNVTPHYGAAVKERAMELWRVGMHNRQELSSIIGCSKRTIDRWIRGSNG